MSRVNNIEIEDGQIIFRNFSGKVSENNPKGIRTVTFVIPEEIKDKLISDGWNVRLYIPKNDPEALPIYILEATVCYRNKAGEPQDPHVFIVKSDGLMHVTEDIAFTLDSYDILKVDAVLRPFYWEMNGRRGIRPYVNKMYITINEDRFDKKYRSYIDHVNESALPTDGDLDLPFPVE